MPNWSFRQGSLLQNYFLLEHYTAVFSLLFMLFLIVITRNPVSRFQGWMQRLFCHETVWDLYCFQSQLRRTQVFTLDFRIWVSSFVGKKKIFLLKNTNYYKIGGRKKKNKFMTFTIFCLLILYNLNSASQEFHKKKAWKVPKKKRKQNWLIR